MTEFALLPAGQRALKLWRGHQREAVALGGMALAGIVAAAGSALSTPNIDAIRAERLEHAAPAPPPLLVRDLAPTDAVAVNENIPVANGPNPAALPFSTAGTDSPTRSRALECLTSAVYYEAGSQSDDGERAVAQVVLNRVRHPAFPSTVCGVVYQGSTRVTGCQFTFTCDGSLQRRPDAEGWARARRVAEAALTGTVFGPVGWATHYHADYVVPYWAATLTKNAVVGAHLFYRWAGGWGRPGSFVQGYAKQEPSADTLRTAALAAFAARPRHAALPEVADIPGATAEDAPAGRIAVRFTLEQRQEARKAVEATPHEDYVEKVAASENLRWTLSGAPDQAPQKPLGRAPASTAPAAQPKAPDGGSAN